MKNIMKKFASLALVTTLFVGTQAPTALAVIQPGEGSEYKIDGATNKTSISKTLEIKDSVQVRDQFEFNIEPVDPNTLTPVPNIAKLEKGVDDLITVNSNKTDEKIYKKDDNKSSIDLSINQTKLNTLVGKGNTQRRFLYKITEVPGNRDGMTYDKSVKYLVVEAMFNNPKKPNDSPMFKYPKAYTRTIAYNEDFSQKLGSLDFINGYGKDPDGTPNTKVRELKVEKVVKDAYGKNDTTNQESFTITVNIKGQVGDIFTYKDTNHEITADNVDTGVGITLTLKHGDVVSIDGLTDNDEIMVVEDATVKKTYDVSGEVDKFEKLSQQDNGKVTITNKMKPDIPLTGLLNNIAPFILVIGLAGVFAVIYFKKNQRELA